LSRLTDESTSVERQREIIEGWAKLHGHTIIGWATDLDFSRSNRPFDAPEFGPWLQEPKMHEWDIVAGWRLDRFGAGSINMNELFGWCQRNGKTLVSVTESLDLSTWTGRLVASIIAGVAEGEVEADRERALGSRSKLRKLGRWPGGQPPYWLRPVKTEDGWKLHLDPETVPITRQIITDFLNKKPIETIVQKLNDEGHPSPRDWHRIRSQKAAEAANKPYTGKPPEGFKWQWQTVALILKSQALLGYVEHRGVIERDDKGLPIQNAEALLTPAEFDQIQAELARRKEGRFHREKNAGPLLGIAVCLVCGRNLHHKTQRTRGHVYRYYTTRCKHSREIRAEDLEAVTAQMVIGVILGGFAVHRREFIPAEDHTAELEAAVRGLEELAQMAGTAQSETARETLQRQMSALDARIAELEALPSRPARTELRPTGVTYAEEWERLDEEGRRELLLNTGIQVAANKNREGRIRIEVILPDDLRERMGIPADQPYGLSGGDS